MDKKRAEIVVSEYLTQIEVFFHNLANDFFGQIAIFLFILLITHLVVRFMRALVSHKYKTRVKFAHLTKTQEVILKHFVAAFIYLIGIAFAIYSIPSWRTLSYSFLAGAGVLAVIVGFASQQAFANVVSGIFIAIFTPFRIGDVIELKEGALGVVDDINLRHTTIRTFENKRIIIPNAHMNSAVITNFNIDDEKICRFVEMQISYDSDISKAMKIMQEEARKHPSHIPVIDEYGKAHDDIRVKVIGFGESSVNLRAWVWAQNPTDAYIMGWDLNKSIKERFDREGIEIPYPYRTIVEKKLQKKSFSIKKKIAKKVVKKKKVSKSKKR